MYYLYHNLEKKPLSYDPVTDQYKTVSHTRYLKIWDYQHLFNVGYMQQLSEKFNYLDVRKLSTAALAKLQK